MRMRSRKYTPGAPQSHTMTILEAYGSKNLPISTKIIHLGKEEKQTLSFGMFNGYTHSLKGCELL